MDEIIKDKRFAHVVTDPRFRRMPKKERKIKIDKRFKDMFTNDKFKLKCSVDKRGRPIKLSSNENLKRFYDLSDDSLSESDSDTDSESDSKEQKKVKQKESLKKENKIVDDILEPGSSESSDSMENDEHKNEHPEEVSHKEQKVTGSKKERTKVKKKTTHVTSDPRFKLSDAMVDDAADSNENEDKEAEPTSSKIKKEKTEKNDLEKVDETETKVSKDKKKRKKKKKKKKTEKSLTGENSDSDVSEDKNELLSRAELDFARGEAEFSSSSEEEDEDIEKDEEIVHDWADLDGDVEEVQDATSRLAICNLDWDRVSSKDIFTALNSFTTNNGFIKSVKIYLSEYGKERIEREKSEGPRELKEMEYDEKEDESFMEDKIVKESFTERLRKYQFNRLRYYYGVVECNSTETAEHLYKELDGSEYETSCTKFDLRFIPEDMEFDKDDIRSECDEMPHGYQPDLFKNYAMAFSKAELTWDETDRIRQMLVSKQFSNNAEDIKEDDLRAYLADSSDDEGADFSKLIDQSDSGSESEDRETEEKQIDKYKKLLLELDNEQKDKMKGDVQMEITWEMGLKETTEELVKKKSQPQSSDKSLWEQYLDRKKEKKKEKRKDKKQKNEEALHDDEEEQEGSYEAFSDDDVPADLRDDPFFADEMDNNNPSNNTEQGKKKKKKKGKTMETKEEDETEKAALSLLMMDEDDNKKHFNLKTIIEEDNKEGKKKKKKKKWRKEEVKKQEEDNFELNVKDPRFAAIYDSHLYNIDPSAPEYKKTKGSEALITEKLKRSVDTESKKRSKKDKPTDSAKKLKLDSSDKQKDESLASLVKSVKAKTKSFQSSKSLKER